jgi:uncharacterized protein (DUF1800 family)
MPITSNLGLNSYGNSLSQKQCLFILNRTTFGASFRDLNQISGLSITQIMDKVFSYKTISNTPVNNYQNVMADPNVPFGASWVNDQVIPSIDNLRYRSFASWLGKRLIEQELSIQEKLTLFLHNLLPVQATVVQDSRKLFYNYKLLFENAYGSYKDLVIQVTKNPAMLVYLNGRLNNKVNPDENYARELLELFTVGKGKDSKYTEDDVKAASRILTGYQLTADGLGYIFNPNRHDSSNKVFSSFFNNTEIKGKTGTQGEDELIDLVNMLFNQKETARHFCRKLYKFFVYYEIDSTIENQVIIPLADYFIAQNYNIKEVLKKLLMSEHFWDSENYGAMIKSPLDYVIGVLRAVDIKRPNISNIEQSYAIDFDFMSHAGLLSQSYYEPPAVSGWDAYHQFPLFHETWINTTSANNRSKIATFYLIGYKKNGFDVKIDVIELTKYFNNPSDPNLLAEEAIFYFHTLNITAELKTKLVSILKVNQVQDYYWTNAWNDHLNNPNDTAKKKIATDILTVFYKYIFDLAEFQLI